MDLACASLLPASIPPPVHKVFLSNLSSPQQGSSELIPIAGCVVDEDVSVRVDPNGIDDDHVAFGQG